MKTTVLRSAFVILSLLGLVRATAQQNTNMIVPPFTNTFKIGNGAAGSISTNTIGAGAFSVIGGGLDIGGTNDDFTFHSFVFPGNFNLLFASFDCRARISSLEPNTAWTKAGLMFRESMTTTSRMMFCYATPQGPTLDGGNGAGVIGFSYRTNALVPSADTSTNFQGTYPQVSYPTNYLRLASAALGVTNFVSAFSSPDGVNWYVLGGFALSSSLANATNVGLAVCRGTNGPLLTVGAEYREFSFSTNSSTPYLFLSSIGNQVVNENTTNGPLFFYDRDIGNGGFPVTVSSSRSDIVPNDTNHIIIGSTNGGSTLTLIPATNAFGTTAITLYDVIGPPTVTMSFTLTVLPVNHPPTMNPPNPNPLNMPENFPGSFVVSLTGISPGPASESNQVISITATSSIPSVVPNPVVNYTTNSRNGSISVVSATNQFGSNVITVTLKDTGGTSNGGSDTSFYFITNVVYAVNQFPTLALGATSATNRYIQNLGGGLYQLNLIKNDPAQHVTVTNIVPGPPNEYTNQSLNLSVVNTNAALLTSVSVSPTAFAINTFPASGLLNMTPVSAATGSNTLSIIANDNVGSNNLTTNFLLVNVHGTNSLPTLALSTNRIHVLENVQTNLLLTYGDSETPFSILQASASSSNPAIISSNNISFSPVFNFGSFGLSSAGLTPVQDVFGTNQITFTITDTDGGMVQSNLIFEVEFTNHPPTMDQPRNMTVVENSGLQTNLLTGISPGPPSEVQLGQFNKLSVGVSNTNLISGAQVSLTSPTGPYGYVTFSLVPNMVGNSFIYVTNNDSGGFPNSTNVVSFRVTVISSSDVAKIGQGTADFVNRLYWGPANVLTTNPNVRTSSAFFSGWVTTNWSAGNFAPAATLAAGLSPNAVAAADVSGHGSLDLIAVNYSASTMTVFTNNGRGVFASNATFAAGSYPYSVAVADVNGDGKPDAIVADYGANALTVFTNDGHGNFASKAVYPVGSFPECVIAVDLNGDGTPDLVAANAGTNTLTVLTNNAAGGFGSNATLTVGTGPRCVVAADVNGDGRPDLISANSTGGSLTIWTNTGNGFSLASTLSLGSSPYSVCAADVNGDGRPDLIWAGINGSFNSLTVLTNNGNGGFGPSSTNIVGSGVNGVIAADVNGDGKVDLISANYNTPTPTLSILTNNGTGGFSLASSPAVGGAPWTVIAADLNHSGLVDLITANPVSNTISVLLNSGKYGPYLAQSSFGQSFASSPLGLPYLQMGGTIDPPPLAQLNSNSSFTSGAAFLVTNNDGSTNLYASQPGLLQVNWFYPLTSNYVTTTYYVLNSPASGLDPGTMYVTDITNGTNTSQTLAPPVYITNNLVVIPHYNSIVSSNVLGMNPIPGGVQLRATNGTGNIVLEYRDTLSNAFLNVQTVMIKPGQPDNVLTNIPIGTVTNMPGVTNGWLTFVNPHTNITVPLPTKGLTAGSPSVGYYAYQYENGTNDTMSGQVFATQQTPDANEIELYWFKQSYGITWPDEMDHYQAVWPTNWQNNAVRIYLTRTDDGAATTAPGVPIPVLTVPNVTIHYNTNIPPYWNPPNGATNTLWLETGSRQLQAEHFTGPILLTYNYPPPQGFIGFELVNVKPYFPDTNISTFIGQQLHPINAICDVTNGAPRPLVSRGGSSDNPSYLYQHASPDPSTPSMQEGYIFGIRKTTNTTSAEVFWNTTGVSNLVIWPLEMDRYSLDWPSNQPSGPNGYYQLYSRGPAAGNLGASVAISSVLQPQVMPYQDPPNQAVLNANTFSTLSPGWSLLKYAPSNNVAFQVVRAVDHRDAGSYGGNAVYNGSNAASIGVEVLETDIANQTLIATDSGMRPAPGYIYLPSDSTIHQWDRYDWEIYDGSTNDPPGYQTSQIFPVNLGNLEVWWSTTNQGVSWPSYVKTYGATWITNQTIVIASEQGSGPLSAGWQDARLYIQNDRTQTGFNPNDEQALLYPVLGGTAAFALRSDLGTSDPSSGSLPFVLLKFHAFGDTNWSYQTYHVVAQYSTNTFDYPLAAGSPIYPPYPLSVLDFPPFPQATNVIIGGAANSPAFQDRNNAFWASAGGNQDGTTNNVVMQFHYPIENSFYFPDWYTNNSWYVRAFPTGIPVGNQPPTGSRMPWLDYATNNSGPGGVPVDVTYAVYWPAVSNLFVGETLSRAKKGLPDVYAMLSAQIIYQQSLSNGFGQSVQLIDPTVYRTNALGINLNNLVLKAQTTEDNGLIYFPTLPAHLRDRFWYDPATTNLCFKGQWVDASGIVEPQGYLLLNVISQRDLQYLLQLSDDTAYWAPALKGLATNIIVVPPNTPFDQLAISAGTAQGTGYVTFVENDSTNLNSPGDPIALHIFRVDWPLYQGELKIIPSDDPFDERLTLRQSGDFGGHADQYAFRWYLCPDSGGQPSAPPPIGTNQPSTNWVVFQDSSGNPYGGAVGPHLFGTNGAVDITLEGASPLTLEDNWFICQYIPLPGTFASNNAPVPISAWTTPQLAEGWIKRVLQGINPFEQRIQNYQNTTVNTIVSMISQAGPPYLGATPLNAAAVNNFGLIEIYQTVLDRGMTLGLVPGNVDPNIMPPLLLAAGRLVDLNMLLGNEAYADAADPTIGFGTDDNQYGTVSTSIFCFMNQEPSLLDEELCLLRGRDDMDEPGVQVYPYYNRLIWNFTQGIDAGEVAYALNYNIRDQNGGVSGVIDENTAETLYPQGHGDAWGYYLSAVMNYYTLLTNPNFEWTNASESITVGGQPVQVDYMHERKFCQAASAKAQTGAQIVNLTYRKAYVESQDTTWYDVPDTSTNGVDEVNYGPRAWSVGEWASRAGQGAFFDWVVGNALLPAVSTNSGIQAVDRTSVTELGDIISGFNHIAAQLDNADTGLNPLGLAQNAVPFDIDPSLLTQSSGQTHFEQIYNRALLSLNNAVTTFNNAVGTTQDLREQSDSLTKFQQTVYNQEVDFTNQLIQIYGYPYPEDIGPGGSYPDGYNGPDLVYPHYNYIDVAELTGVPPPTTMTVTQQFVSFDTDSQGVITNSVADVPISLSTAGLSFVRPASWTTPRKATGDIQKNLGDLVQARVSLLKGLNDYDNLLNQIDDQVAALKEQYSVDANQITLMNSAANEAINFNDQIANLRQSEMSLRSDAQDVNIIANATASFLPLSVGFSFDATSAVRGAIQLAAGLTGQLLNGQADDQSVQELDLQQAKEEEQTANNIQLTTVQQGPGLTNLLNQLTQLVRQEPGMRYTLYNSEQTMMQAAETYQTTLAKGQQTVDDRTRFRQQTAEQIEAYRFKDMAFRIFRNDALQKYWDQFDLSSRYVYLAAKAYDYETCLLPWDPRGPGQTFLTEIVQSQNLGLFQNNTPVTGSGNSLADSMATMWQNWSLVLKGQLGFNNPETETDYFSIRRGLWRTQDSTNASSLSVWTNTLQSCVVSNILTMPEYIRYCIPFEDPTNAPADGEPGIVITFSSTVTFGDNFFGWPLGGNDSAYDPTHFATKIRGVGVWFDNYDSLNLSLTPRVYLIPIGNDVLRSPSGDEGTTREFPILDQLLPVPYPNPNAMQDPNWIPIDDSIDGNLGDIRKYGSFRAYNDGGFTTDQMTYSSRLVGRSVWNRKWMLIIPAGTLLGDRQAALKNFIMGANGDGNGVSDIKLFFQTYSYQGN